MRVAAFIPSEMVHNDVLVLFVKINLCVECRVNSMEI